MKNQALLIAANRLHAWCRGEGTREGYAVQRTAIGPVEDPLNSPRAVSIAAAIALIPADRRDRAIKRCKKLFAKEDTIANLAKECSKE